MNRTIIQVQVSPQDKVELLADVPSTGTPLIRIFQSTFSPNWPINKASKGVVTKKIGEQIFVAIKIPSNVDGVAGSMGLHDPANEVILQVSTSNFSKAFRKLVDWFR